MALAPSSNDTYRFDFEYVDNAVTKTDVELIKFTATETISRPYEYSITVKPKAASGADVYNILNLECRIKIYTGPSTGPDLSFTHIKTISGVVVEVEDADYHGNDAYIVRMIPKLGLLEKVRNNAVFIERDLKSLVEDIVTEGSGLLGGEYEAEGISASLNTWSFRMQYAETSLNFLHRILERHAHYYYFENSKDTSTKPVFTASGNRSLEQIALTDNLVSKGVGALDAVDTLSYRRISIPKSIKVTDYGNGKDFFLSNPNTVSNGPISEEENLNTGGSHSIIVDGLNLIDDVDAQLLVGNLVKAHKFSEYQLTGRSNCCNVVPGYVIQITSTGSSDKINRITGQDWFVIKATHRGHNTNLLDGSDADSNLPGYSNTFETRQISDKAGSPRTDDFYPEMSTPTPKIEGQIVAEIEGATEQDAYAHLDSEGRYKVRFPFDFANTTRANKSGWIRALQPYGGNGHGVHFPFSEGAKVLIGFVCGDPDRPYIAGAIGDSIENSSIVNSTNNETNLIRTRGGNELNLTDTANNQSIKLKSNSGTKFSIEDTPSGSHEAKIRTADELNHISLKQNDTGVGRTDPNRVDALSLVTNGQFRSTAQRGAVITSVARDEEHYIPNVSWENIVTGTSLFAFPNRDEFGETDNQYLSDDHEAKGTAMFHRTVGDKHIFERGNEYQYNTPGDTRYNFGADKSVVICASDVDLHTMAQYGGSTVDRKALAEANRNLSTETSPGLTAKDELYLFVHGLRGYMPFDQSGVSGNRIDEPLGSGRGNWLLDQTAQVYASKHNTFNIQRGNIFDFGGYWTYNLGNSYEENHIDQQPEINRKETNDIVDSGGHAWTTIRPKELSPMRNGEAWVTKNYGHSYDYSKGNSLEVSDGDTESHTHGNSYDFIYGDAKSHTDGNSEDHVFGNSAEFTIGASSSMTLGATSDLKFGLSNDMFIGLSNSMKLAGYIDMSLGPNISGSTVSEIGTSLTAAKTSLTNIRNDATSLATSAIETTTTGVKNATAGLANYVNGLTMFS